MLKKYVQFFFWYIENFSNIFTLVAVFLSGKRNHKRLLRHKSGFVFIIENALDLITIREVMNDYDILSLQHTWKDAHIIDIGGHKGYFSCFLSYLNHTSTIHCYEPNPALYAIIVEHIKLNKLTNCIVSNTAVGAENGKLKFGLYGDFNSNAGTLHFDTIAHKDITLEKVIEVDVQSINTILDPLYRVSFFKIDCEGEEFRIFEKISVRNLEKIENVICEFHEFNGNKKETILTKFLEHHFTLQKLYYILNENKQGIMVVKK